MKKNNIFKKPAAIFAVMTICFSLTVTAMASSGVLKGFFQDIKRPDGAVIGTTYEQATEEIAIKANVDSDVLIVVASFTGKAPFEAEEMKITDFQIVDRNGKVVKESFYTEYAEIVDRQAKMKIALDDIDNGSYKLVVNSFTANKKADQPMQVNGNWSANFTK